MADAPKLVDMAYTAKELKQEQKEMSVGYDGQPSPYPWGLCIRLEKEELDKLGLSPLPAIGAEINFTAVAKVTSVSQSASQTRDEEACCGLQITMLEITSMESPEEEAAEGPETPAKEMADSKSVTSKYR